jgi:hypothetical protein
MVCTVLSTHSDCTVKQKPSYSQMSAVSSPILKLSSGRSAWAAQGSDAALSPGCADNSDEVGALAVRASYQLGFGALISRIRAFQPWVAQVGHRWEGILTDSDAGE